MSPDEPLTLREVVAALESVYPPETAMDWDQVGLVAGDLDQAVRTVHFAVDPTLAVVQEAVDAGADLLVTHHPLLLRGIHSVATTGAKGETLTRAILGDLAIYCAHTNADVASPGVCDALAAAVGLHRRRAARGRPVCARPGRVSHRADDAARLRRPGG